MMASPPGLLCFRTICHCSRRGVRASYWPLKTWSVADLTCQNSASCSRSHFRAQTRHQTLLFLSGKTRKCQTFCNEIQWRWEICLELLNRVLTIHYIHCDCTHMKKGWLYFSGQFYTTTLEYKSTAQRLPASPVVKVCHSALPQLYMYNTCIRLCTAVILKPPSLR